MQNHLKNQTSPYLLQHVNNPVDWYPWCAEAFQRAKQEDKPVFLSIGYSTCHWCHVMAHESFEDQEIAEILNQHFVSIKVDKEERPDIDSIYMSVCQAFTGSGGWPTTVFLTPEQKPFYAGTYFPKTARYGQPGLRELLLVIQEAWKTNREALTESAENVIAFLEEKNTESMGRRAKNPVNGGTTATRLISKDDVHQLIDAAFELYKRMFDEEYGGFGQAPKFPTPHNLLFLMKYYEKSGKEEAMKMVEKTLLQMYKGGIFDHIGGGFSRYSTDPYFLVPHFEKMLYDNALLIIAYCKAYQITENPLFCQVAERTAAYILREMTSEEGGFFSAQDADSEGVEGKYYLFEPAEITEVLGMEAGEAFNRHFDITESGNFEGKNIPNLLKHVTNITPKDFEGYSGTEKLYEYRKKRYALHLDDKILTSWNGLMIGALCHLYRVTGNEMYFNAAKKAQDFIERELLRKTYADEALYVSYREGKRGGKGFLEDYANEVFALLALYEASLDKAYLIRARQFVEKAIAEFYDEEKGGFFLYGKENEQLILRPKETHDGAMPSGNSMMAYNLVHMYYLTGEKRFEDLARRQVEFQGRIAADYPAGYGMFLVALSEFSCPPDKVTVVLAKNFCCRIPLDTIVCVLEEPTEEYPLLNDRTTYYVCRGYACLPPTNEYPL